MKIRYSQLKKVVVEEMIALGLLPSLKEVDGKKLKSTESEKGKEIDPGDEADTLAKPTDFQKALKIKEAKLLRALGETRAQLKNGK
jgi:hypothetical protein